MKLSQLLGTSIVIPTYNREKLLKATLLSLSKQNYPKDKYEIIVVDDGDDGTDNMIEKLNISNLRYFKIENLGYKCVSRARNFGIKKAENGIIVFVDSDIVVTPNFILEHVKNHVKNRNLVVIGYTSALANEEKHNNKKIMRIVEKNYNKISKIPIIPEYREGIYKSCSDNLNKFATPWETFITSNVSVRKQHIIDVGMFDENFRGWGLEDIELGYRLIKRGLIFKLNRNALGYHIGTDNILNPYVDPSPKKWKNYIRNMKYFLKKFNNSDVKKTLIIHNRLIPDKFKMFKNEPKKHLLKIYNMCNNNCLVCKVLNKKVNKKTLDEIKQHLDVIANKEELIISGGEPALREDVFDIIGYAKGIGFKRVILETNGRLFCYKDFCEKMIRSGVDQFNVYLYSNRPEVHDSITKVKGSWMQTVEGIKNLIDMNAIVQANVVVCKENYRDLNNTINLLRKMKINYMNIFSRKSENNFKIASRVNRNFRNLGAKTSFYGKNYAKSTI